MKPLQPEQSGRSTNRGVSDVVAFVLTFAIIIAGVGIVSTGGFDRLTEFTNDQQVDNGERGMEAAASTVDNLHRNNDTYREFDLSLSGGNVWFNDTAITIRTGSGDDPDLSSGIQGASSDEAKINVSALEHRFDLNDETVSIAFEGGGVFRTGTSRARYGPGVRIDGDTAIISLINLTTGESIDRAGVFGNGIAIEPTGVPQEAPVSADSQFISFTAELVGQDQVYEASTGNSDISVDVSESAYPQQWGYYFDEAGGWTNPSSNVYRAEQVDTVLVRISTIELSVQPD